MHEMICNLVDSYVSSPPQKKKKKSILFHRAKHTYNQEIQSKHFIMAQNSVWFMCFVVELVVGLSS